MLGGVGVIDTLDVFSVKQILDALLDDRKVGLEAGREDVDDLGDEKVVRKLLASPVRLSVIVPHNTARSIQLTS